MSYLGKVQMSYPGPFGCMLVRYSSNRGAGWREPSLTDDGRIRDFIVTGNDTGAFPFRCVQPRSIEVRRAAAKRQSHAEDGFRGT